MVRIIKLFKSTKNAKIKEESDDKCRKKVKEGERIPNENLSGSNLVTKSI